MGAQHRSDVPSAFGVAPAILSPVGSPDWEEHRRQDRRRYQARVHASGVGFPELFIPMSHPWRRNRMPGSVDPIYNLGQG